MPRTETINIIVQTKGAEKDVKKLGKGLEETKKEGKKETESNAEEDNVF